MTKKKIIAKKSSRRNPKLSRIKPTQKNILNLINGKWYIIPYHYNSKKDYFDTLKWNSNDQDLIHIGEWVSSTGEVEKIKKIIEIIGPFDSKLDAHEWLL